MTDSVKRDAFSDVLARAMRTSRRSALLYPSWNRKARLVERAIVFGGADDALDVVLRLGERNVVHELVAVDPGPLAQPVHDAHVAGVVGRQRHGDIPIEFLHEVGEKRHA